MKRSLRAFTLVELLVVVGIIAMLAGILMPSYVTAMDMARETTCRNNLSLLSKAAYAYMGQNTDTLPRNDPEDVTYRNFDANNLLPGVNSTLKWWCNKVYPHGPKRFSIYVCPSEPGRAGDTEPVKCGYGFNNTLTDPAPTGDGAITIHEILDTERTAIIGHCSDYTREPAFSEDIVLKAGASGAFSGDYWPRGHMARYDREAKQVAGRCGFIMASGAWVVKTFSDAVQLKDEDGKLVMFHK